MKLKALAQICKKNKTAYIINAPDGTKQYISTGEAVYPIYGLPELTPELLLTVFDIPSDEWGKWVVDYQEYPESYSLDDIEIEAHEEVLPKNLSIIRVRGLSIIYGSHGLPLIFNTELLKPLSDLKGDFELYERSDMYGDPYIVIKKGFILAAVIFPNVYDEVVYTELKKLYEGYEVLREYYSEESQRERRQRSGVGEQMMLTEMPLELTDLSECEDDEE